LGTAAFDPVGLGVSDDVGGGLGESRDDSGGDGVADELAIEPFDAGAGEDPQAPIRTDAAIKARSVDNDRMSRTLVDNCRFEIRRLPPGHVTNLPRRNTLVDQCPRMSLDGATNRAGAPTQVPTGRPSSEDARARNESIGQGNQKAEYQFKGEVRAGKPNPVPEPLLLSRA
jgi:hypothetical protein